MSTSAQRVGLFNFGSSRVGYWTKYRVAGRVRVGLGSGRSVEKYDRVFPGIFFSFGYFRVFQVFPGMSGIFGYLWVYAHILGVFSNIK